jgi:DNA polymerase III subunit delta'
MKTMIWPAVLGQRRVKEALLGAFRNNRLPHAYLFYGNEGVGKDAVALELARVLHCEKNQDEACGVCSSCTKMASLQHPDVKLVVALPVGRGEEKDDPPLLKLSESEIKTIQEQFRLKAQNPYHRISIPRANIIKINSIREVRRESSLTTFDARRRVIIISHADQMGDEASNTILKTLEEPSGKTMLILTSAQREALLPTIVSRCQNVRFDPLSEEEIRLALVERNDIDKRRAGLVARLANGSYVRALELLDDDLAKERQDVIVFVKNALGSNPLKLTEEIDRFSGPKDRERVLRFLTLMLMWFRDALVLMQGGEVINLDQQDDLKSFVAKFPASNLIQVLADIENAISLVNRNVYIMLVLLRLSVQMKENILPERQTREAREVAS